MGSAIIDFFPPFFLFLICFCIGFWLTIGIIQVIIIFSVNCCNHCIDCLVATETLVGDTKRKIKLRRPINCVVIYPVVAAQELPYYEGDTRVTAASTICDADIIIEED